MSRKSDYEHFYPEAKLDPGFPSEYNIELIESIEELREVFEGDHPYIAWDLETTDLDPTKGDIVGYSFSFDGKSGYYVPVYHLSGTSLGKEALDLFYEKLKKASRTFVANMRFDYRYMMYAGYDMLPIPYYDVLIGLFLADTNIPMPSLKKGARHFLGWDMKTFDETLGDNYNFYYLHPEDAYTYAAIDALATFNLAKVTIKFYQEAKLSGKLDNEVLIPLLLLENEPISMDLPYLMGLHQEQVERLKDLELSIYGRFGYSLKLTSGKQLSEGLQRLGLDTGKYVKSGYMKTDIPTLNSLYDKTKHPVLKEIIEYKQLFKSIGSYTETLIRFSQEKDSKLRFAYHNTRVPTGRLACGADGKNTFFVKVNAQSIPKTGSKMWYLHEWDGVTEYPGDECIGGYRYSLTDKSSRVVEGADLTDNIRRAFLPDKDCYWVSIDFNAQELRIPANLSKEPVWVNAFLNKDDIHKVTAISIWDEESYDRDKRDKAKTANFGILYGMSGYSFAERFRISVEEGEDFVRKFKSSLPQLFRWQQSIINKARKEGTAYNYFGRPRRVRYWVKHPDGKQRAFGIRTISNTVIQSVGADILKICLIKFYTEKLEKKNPLLDGVRILSNIHDEINYSVPKDKLEEVVKYLVDMMTLKIPGWVVPMEVGIEIGNAWGTCFAYRLIDGELVPKAEAVKEVIPEEVEEEIIEEEDILEFNITF